jgi:hypothetical protein
MKMFQYLTMTDEGQQEEIWVCEYCRRQNYKNILVGNWRLIDKHDATDCDCARCSQEQQPMNMAAMKG